MEQLKDEREYRCVTCRKLVSTKELECRGCVEKFVKEMNNIKASAKIRKKR